MKKILKLAIAMVIAATVLTNIGPLPALLPGGFPGGSAASLADGAGTASFDAAAVVRVVDGDTLVVNAGAGEEKVRCIGVDAPESVHADESLNTREGSLASEYVKSLVGPGDIVYLQTDVSDTDQHGRLLRYVWLEKPSNPLDPDEVEGKMLNAIIVSKGYAQAKRYEPDVAYSDILDQLQEDAAAAGKGVSYMWP